MESVCKPGAATVVRIVPDRDVAKEGHSEWRKKAVARGEWAKTLIPKRNSGQGESI